MGHEDIHAAIASALDEFEEGRHDHGSARLAHGHHIIEQYAAFFREEEFHDAEPSAEVVIRIESTSNATGAAGNNSVSSLLKKRVSALLSVDSALAEISALRRVWPNGRAALMPPRRRWSGQGRLRSMEPVRL
jgi:hypothetical protein